METKEQILSYYKRKKESLKMTYFCSVLGGIVAGIFISAALKESPAEAFQYLGLPVITLVFIFLVISFFFYWILKFIFINTPKRLHLNKLNEERKTMEKLNPKKMIFFLILITLVYLGLKNFVNTPSDDIIRIIIYISPLIAGFGLIGYKLSPDIPLSWFNDLKICTLSSLLALMLGFIILNAGGIQELVYKILFFINVGLFFYSVLLFFGFALFYEK
ncbi:MAG: hypothetical protein ABH849_02490 [Nanoarchaeota archaeon]